MKILLIDANPKTSDYSHSKWAADHYVDALKEKDHYVEVWPLYQMKIPMIDEEVMSAFGKSMKGMELTEEEFEKMNLRNLILDKFVKFDHYVIVSPLWNFGVPPQLKALIDVIAVAGKTFKYTENGPVGLLEGTFVHIQASGGVYKDMMEMEFGNRYVSHIFKFLGLEEKLALLIEGTNMGDFSRNDYQSTLDDWVTKSVREVM
ncbi:FMN-dependent NADH-azoreductase [Acidaminobacter sp. JC074]|uniref:FMN-dependent NADH-azoreductase n=1 Tax=Acidaminobacter sp. JC074 TaxID=2530199 RepID=UPI001F0DC1BD|nr:NAD(P)H-dependent oxidoreductase [Acidaminobacter sp. JC074]MCH4887173.1 FMN-dependent NADH-azoreductase [Acidaminobacter sp. JC074]